MAGDRKGPQLRLTPELTAEICKMIEIMVPEKYAAEANGISEATHGLWMRKGAAALPGDEVYVTYFQTVTRARAKAVGNMHVRALSGGKGSSAATWFLERRLHREYAQFQRVEMVPADPLSVIGDDGELEAAIEAQRAKVKEYERVRTLLDKGKGTEQGS